MNLVEISKNAFENEQVFDWSTSFYSCYINLPPVTVCVSVFCVIESKYPVKNNPPMLRDKTKLPKMNPLHLCMLYSVALCIYLVGL
jgi:hypothetical protein